MASVGDILRVAIHYTGINAGDVMNVFHFKIGGIVYDEAVMLAGINEWVADEWGARWAQMSTGSYTLSHWEADIINTDGTVAENIGGDIVDLDGTVGGESLPPQAACYLMAYTALPKQRGSKYVPGPAENETNGGGLNAALLADVALLLAVYLTGFTSTGGLSLTPGLLSKTLEAFVPFLAAGAIESLTATQRRRKVGVGI